MRTFIFLFYFIFLNAVLSAETKANTAISGIEINSTTFVHNQIPSDHSPAALGFLVTTESDAEDEDEITHQKNTVGSGSSTPVYLLLTAVLPAFLAIAENSQADFVSTNFSTNIPLAAFCGFTAALRI